MRYVSLTLLLFAFWLALSGHYTAFLIWAGVSAAALTTYVAARMHVADEEGQPVSLIPAATTYYPWLGWEIAKSAFNVARIVLDPRLPISPTMTVVAASQRTPVGLATYANSITLTPGTITTGVKADGTLTVHALVREGALELEAGGMDQRVTRFEGGA